jgi:VWFA-related protein
MFALRLLLALLIVSVHFVLTPAQSNKLEQNNEKDDDAVVRVTTNLVQIDIVVIDKAGKQIIDLKPEDFEVYEDDQLRKITNLSYINLQSRSETASEPTSDMGKKRESVPLPPEPLRSEKVRRTFAFVIDDIGLSFESIVRARDILKKFVAEKMQPGDLVAIIRTGGGSGALQQFTSNKQLLFAAIDRVRWNINGRSGVSDTQAINDQSSTQLPSGSFDSQNDLDPNAVFSGSATKDEFERVRRQFLTVGSLGALKFVIGGMSELPGRKALVLLSDGFRIPSKPENQDVGNPIIDYLRALTEEANRASVAIYTIDGRGLQTFGLRAEDSLDGEVMAQTENGPQILSGGPILQQKMLSVLDSRRDTNFETQSGLIYLASRTGGFFTTDLNTGFNRILDEQKGFYLLGYDPDESNFNTRRGRRTFHKLKVKVKRPGLRVRARAGFFGVTDDITNEARRTRGEKIIAALKSPFTAADIPLRLTALYYQDEKEGTLLKSLLHIDAAKLSFTEEADGFHKAVFDLVAVNYGENGQPVDQISKTYTIRLRSETYERILKDGFVYIFNIPIKNAGPCQIRVVVRDKASDKVGSASQFMKLPDIKEDRLTLSGIVITGSEANRPTTTAVSPEEEVVAQNLIPALRRLRQGMVLNYSYHIYNAQIDRATQRPNLKSQIKLYHNGREIFAGPEKPFDITGQKDLKKLLANGRLLLGTEMAPGEYVLQITITDELGKENHRKNQQFIDFEILK